MCGIFGVHNQEHAVDTILHGLKQLEYRGYDSAGLAMISDDDIVRRRAEGKISNLQRLIDEQPILGNTGIGHTRWATHGSPTSYNAHPHRFGDVVVVHNGIIENYQSLKQQLIQRGHEFSSDTDSEVIPHMIQQYLNLGYAVREAISATLEELEGSYALGILLKQTPNKIYAARNASPLAIGESESGLLLASDALALANFSDSVYYPEDQHLVELSAAGPSITKLNGKSVTVSFCDLHTDDYNVSKSGFDHFMLKEIHEQDEVAKSVLSQPFLIDRDLVNSTQRLHMVACGSSYYAASAAKYWFESIAGIPVNLDIASEFRYRDTPFLAGDATLFISQSGETADTLAAMEYAQQAQVPAMCLVNVATSTMARNADHHWLIHAGPEIGVASTKALTAQLLQLIRMATEWAHLRGITDAKQYLQQQSAIHRLPEIIENLLTRAPEIKDLVPAFQHASSALYLGRGSLCPVAKEGALKLKEISYIHAEGYAFGELKHGPIALVDEQMPVIALINDDHLAEKAISNLQEVIARGAQVTLFAPKSITEKLDGEVLQSFSMPDVPLLIAPLVYLLPLQFIAYQAALLNGHDVDQPRNLAKSVTVE